ncbi:MAG: Obg family GTPase CgtA [Chloroflexi bacterium]|nr:Obg family GTPase CgtA [Chloroflexota bacterium]
MGHHQRWLAQYHTTLGVNLDERPQLVVLNKMDLPDAVAWEPLVAEEIAKAGYPFVSISALTKQGLREMLYTVKQMLDEVDEAPQVSAVAETEIVIRTKEDEDGFTIERELDGWRVSGKRVERIAAMTYFEFEPTATRFSRILESMGITKALEKAGVKVGDIVHIGDEELEWGE